MCAIIFKEPIASHVSATVAEAKAINSLNALLYDVLPVRSPESRERLLFLLTPEAQQQLATRITDEERKQVDSAMDAAIAAWKRIESDFLSSIKMDRVTFIKNISDVVSDGNMPKALSEICDRCRGVVQNVEWVNVFAWQLPIMHPESAEDYFGMARVVGGIFYTERYMKQHNTGTDNMASERITVLLKLAI